MNETWTGRHHDTQVGNDYCTELSRSVTLCHEEPDTFTPGETKRAAWLINQCRDSEHDILEIEVPTYYLTQEALGSLERLPTNEELVLMCINRRTNDVSYLIERETPNLTQAEMKEHEKELEKAMAKELSSWHDHQSFEPRLRSKAKNVIHGRWVHKWKFVDGTKVIKSRLCVRGFKDTQADNVTTSASAAARWGQRMVVSTAARHGWTISLADASTAFLQGM